jgi:hypothetical protein
LQSVCDPLGKTELLNVLTRWEQTIEAAQTGVHAVRGEAGGLLEFQSALVDLRAYLEPLRDQVIQYEGEVDALFWSRAASPPGVEAMLTVIRGYRRTLDDLIFYLPHRRTVTATRSRPAETG